MIVGIAADSIKIKLTVFSNN